MVVVVAVLLQITVAPVQSMPAGTTNTAESGSAGAVKPAEQLEQLDVDPAVIAPVDSPLKHLEKAQTDKKYVEFINDLYKNDKSKTPLTFESH